MNYIILVEATKFSALKLIVRLKLTVLFVLLSSVLRPAAIYKQVATNS